MTYNTANLVKRIEAVLSCWLGLLAESKSSSHQYSPNNAGSSAVDLRATIILESTEVYH